MATLSRRVGILVELFEDGDVAQAALKELRSAGFRESDLEVSFVDRNLVEEGDSENPIGVVTTHAATGLGIGALWGLGMLTGLVPVMTPALSSGTLGVLLSSAAAAATVGSAGALIDLRRTQSRPANEKQDLRKKLTVVTIRAGAREAVASSVLSRFDASQRTAVQAT